jgi:hypothetical protein
VCDVGKEPRVENAAADSQPSERGRRWRGSPPGDSHAFPMTSNGDPGIRAAASHASKRRSPPPRESDLGGGAFLFGRRMCKTTPSRCCSTSAT